MHRKLIMGTVGAAVFLFVAQPQVQAGIFDKLKKKAEEIVKDEAEDKAKETVGLGEAEKSSSSSSAQSSSSGGSPATAPATVSGGKHPTTARIMARAVLSIAPDILEVRPDYDIKSFVKIFYPAENEKLVDEFYWRKNKEKFKAKMLEESEGAPTTFEVAPWIDNQSNPEIDYNKTSNDLIFTVGRYDFDKQAWPVYVPTGNKWPIPWVSSYRKPVSYEIPAVKEAKTYWISMPTDKAEQLHKDFNGMGRLYARYRFTISDVIGVHVEDHPGYEQNKKYMKGSHKDQVIGNLVPIGQIAIAGNKLELYATKSYTTTLSKDDYKFVATLELTP
ncbi:hypothetical protein [Emcibacter nanhaiensis]|uniref:Uncharacterized protein n=1 Tax=Emcibacter nanhaiensis TaxID=1505037 RepID=A0A501PD18_9PROT|nr:hypothetical protein [Emcibacter nanhaiensis]TPD57897.1 hypothetical protein FIV46_17520 [Emcibacter nanhaiensis]